MRPKKLFDQINYKTDFTAIISHQPFTLFSLLINRRLKKIPILYLFISPSYQEYLLINKEKIWPIKFVHCTLRRIIERICLKRADKIMFLSNYMREKAINIHGVRDKCLEYNPAGVDIERFKPIKNRFTIKDELSFPIGKIHLRAYLGNSSLICLIWFSPRRTRRSRRENT